ncbi:unnamed protein product [Ectocarpus sp. CCAP 1310/34]|nr:unnamed protein product [Ectocarpus sp. CCAP 1310/34]
MEPSILNTLRTLHHLVRMVWLL